MALVTGWTEYSDTLNVAIAANADNPYIKKNSQTVHTDDGFMGYTAGPEYRAGCFRFALNIPQGATITTAYITYKCDNGQPDGAIFDIYADDTDNSGQITAWAEWTTAIGRKTTASENWDLPQTVWGANYQTPEIKAVVQEIVDRGGWSSGNYIQFLIDDTASTQYFAWYCYADGSDYPTLYVGYEPFLNTWKATLTTEPTNVWFNGTLGTDAGSIAAIDTANEWFWESDVLYVYSTSDPDTAYTSPGISTHLLGGGDQIKMFQSMQMT